MIKRVINYIVDKILCRSRLFRKYYKEWRIISSSTVGTLMLNFIFQRCLRINGKFKYPIHFTSRITNAEKMIVKGSGHRTVLCLAINGGCYFQAANGIEIGEGVLIAPGVKIISGNHDIFNLDKPARFTKPIVIGNNVWIGSNAAILPAVNIADECIVGAGAIVTKSFNEPGSIIVGNPAAVIRNKYKE